MALPSEKISLPSKDKYQPQKKNKAEIGASFPNFWLLAFPSAPSSLPHAIEIKVVSVTPYDNHATLVATRNLAFSFTVTRNSQAVSR